MKWHISSVLFVKLDFFLPWFSDHPKTEIKLSINELCTDPFEATVFNQGYHIVYLLPQPPYVLFYFLSCALHYTCVLPCSCGDLNELSFRISHVLTQHRSIALNAKFLIQLIQNLTMINLGCF